MCVIYKKPIDTDTSMVIARGKGAGEAEEDREREKDKKRPLWGMNPGCSRQMTFY